MAQREIAHHMGLDETKLSKALNGTRRFHPEELTSLADVTGVTVNWLINGKSPSTVSRLASHTERLGRLNA